VFDGSVNEVASRIRRSVVGALAAVLFLLAVGPASASAATLLYPNLKTLAPRDLRLDRADVDAGEATVMHNVLRFSNTVWNSGPGRLEMRGLIDPKTDSGPAVQRVYDDSGGSTDFAAGSFYYHPAHQHYHYDDWGRYELWTKAGYEAWLASGRTVGEPTVGAKTTSCMIDEEFIRSVPNQPYPPPYETGGCFPDSQGRMLQGISPGWGDTYDYFRFEQWIDLGQNGVLADGRYVLRSVTDPLNKIYESAGKADASRESAEDNEAVTEFAVEGGALVDSNPPSGSVRINDIDAATSSPGVVVKILGRDDISSVDQWRLSDDGSSWSDPQPYTGRESAAQAVSWSLIDPAYGGNASDGPKTVYAEFRDAAGNWSEPETDTIVLDRGGGSSPYSNVVIGDGVAGYWRLGETSGETAGDAAGANAGTYENNPQLGEPSLLPADAANHSVRFDGTDDHVSIPSSSTLSPTARVSVEAWIKPAALPAAGSFASVASKPDSYSLQFNGPRLEFTIMQSGVRRRLQAPAGAIEAGTTYYVVGTYDGTVQRLYIDGVEVADAALTGAISVGSQELSIGAWNETTEPFDGTIDDVAVYTHTLSSARIDAHYQVAIGGSPPDPTVADPSALSATATSETRVDLHWSDNSDNEGEFLIERDTDPGFASPVVQSAWANSTSFGDTGLSPGTAYYYRVRARNATDSSGYSNVASATTPSGTAPSTGTPPGAPPPSSPSSPSTTTSLPTPLGYADAVMDDRPAGYWRLDELSGTTAFDAQGINPGAYRNGPDLGRASLLATDGLDPSVGFDGTDDYVSIPDSNSMSPTPRVSVEAWIKPSALPAVGRIAVIAGRADAYSLQLNGPRLEFTVAQARRRIRLTTRPGLIVRNRIFHVVGVYDGTTVQLFVDGIRVARAPLSGPISPGVLPFDIGSAGAIGRPFRGDVDDVAVYARALSPARVSSHYRAGTAGSKRLARRARGRLYSISISPTYLGYCHLHRGLSRGNRERKWRVSWPRHRS
jgi:hypothetical protein